MPPAEDARRRRRERELLERHGNAWAGSLVEHATTWSFRRGFVEAAELAVPEAAIFDEHPLLSSIATSSTALPALAAIGILPRLRGLLLDDHHRTTTIAQHAAALAHLRSFGIAKARDLDDVVAVVRGQRLEQFWLRHHELERVTPLLPHLSAVQALELTGWKQRLDMADLALLRSLPLRALRTTSLSAAQLAGLVGLPLEKLGLHAYVVGDGAASRQLDSADEARPFAALGASFPTLRVLEQDVGRTEFATALPALRELRVRREIAQSSLRELVAAHGDRLARLDVRLSRTWLGDTQIAGLVDHELALVGKYDFQRELLHADPRAMFTTDTVCSPIVAAEAWCARVDDPRQLDVFPLPTDREAWIGRARQRCDIAIEASCISRRQAVVRRVGPDRYALREDASTLGVLRDGRPLSEAELFDGDELLMGFVVLRYFVGDGALDRARAACDRARLVDPVTGLPRASAHAVAACVTIGWPLVDDRERTLVRRWLATELSSRLQAGETLAHVGADRFGVSSIEAAERIAGTRTVRVLDREVDVTLQVERVVV